MKVDDYYQIVRAAQNFRAYKITEPSFQGSPIETGLHALGERSEKLTKLCTRCRGKLLLLDISLDGTRLDRLEYWLKLCGL